MDRITILFDRPRALAIWIIVLCRILAFMWIVAIAIIPLVIAGLVVAVRRRSCLAVVILVFFNPLSVFFVDGVIDGVIDYSSGAPSVHFYGLPSIESYNPARTGRYFRTGLGCVVKVNMKYYPFVRNSTVKFMSRVFGPAARSYDGPYPTKEEALSFVDNAPSTSVEEFEQGRVHVEGEVVQLPASITLKLLRSLCVYGYIEEQDEMKCSVQARLFKERCLIVRLTEKYNFDDTDEETSSDYLIFFDKQNSRPFAYFTIQGHGVRFHPVRYISD